MTQAVVGSYLVSNVRRRLRLGCGKKIFSKQHTLMTMTRLWWELTYVDD
jgi:hypothetical protein